MTRAHKTIAALGLVACLAGLDLAARPREYTGEKAILLIVNVTGSPAFVQTGLMNITDELDRDMMIGAGNVLGNEGSGSIRGWNLQLGLANTATVQNMDGCLLQLGIFNHLASYRLSADPYSISTHHRSTMYPLITVRCERPEPPVPTPERPAHLQPTDSIIDLDYLPGYYG